VTELELPALDHTDAELRGERFREAMLEIQAHDGWLAANPFGYTVLDRGAGEFFLRTRAAVFPGLTIAEIFQITDGPLHEEIVKNIININGADHSRLRNLVNPALAPRAVARYRPCAASSTSCSHRSRATAASNSSPPSPSPTRRW
jgi:hypothetical protein